MALPQVETTVMELVAEEEAQAKRQAALEAVESVDSGTKALAESPTSAVAQVTAMSGSDPRAFLLANGFSEKDLELDFTSFPTITLNEGKFSSPEHKDMGEKFECVVMMHRDTYLFRADRGRKEEPILVYSQDQIHANDAEKTPMAKYIEEWKAEGYEYDVKEYRLLTVQMIDGPHAGDICQIQVSPASIKKWNGYVVTLALKQLLYRDVVTEVSVGPVVGSGVKSFNPFVFKKVG
jgi:hypothetical protein